MASQRKLRWTGMRASGIGAPALATAAITSMAMFSQPAEATANPSDDGRPTLEDVEAKLDAFYSSQSGSKKDAAAKEKETKRAKTFLDTAARYRTQEPPLLPPPPALPPLPSFPPSITQGPDRAPAEIPAQAPAQVSGRAPAQAPGHDYDFTAGPENFTSAPAGHPTSHEAAPRSADRIPDWSDGMPPNHPSFPELPLPTTLLATPGTTAPETDAPESDLSHAKSVVQGKLSKAQALLSFHTAGQQKATPRQAESTPISAEAERALAFAREQLGKPVVLGAAGPGSFDGPGLTQTAWKSAGVALPRTAFGQVTAGKPIRLPDARPGDLVFFHDAITHVGIYIGEGRMIHAPRPGAYVCEESIHFAGTSEIHSVVRPA
ncbi:C40 family peptidase [Streptomyces niveiscabiei]|uniref:C40 family peptidase n=1 Tax=Streptomyces niveiscabiei TaxID=164115 RepID=UPI0029A2417B|nr:C40 family peptidase [Streptomyces niveiscabiei]MDX3384580.1 C40 family peptidase [Streptomyces niveiscabiei]